MAVFQAHGKGPSQSRPDGGPSHHGVRALHVTLDDANLITGGGDGTVAVWALDGGKLRINQLYARTTS